jgi:hypothetical protein
MKFVPSAFPVQRCSLSMTISGDFEDTMTEQVETAAAVHHELDRLQPADLPLDWPGAPRQRQSRPYRGEIAFRPLAKSAKAAPSAANSQLSSSPARCPQTIGRKTRGTVMVRASSGERAIRAETKACSVGSISCSSAITNHAARRRDGDGHDADAMDAALRMALPQRPYPVPNQCPLTGEAAGLALPPELSGVVAAVIPALPQVIEERIKPVPLGWLTPCRWLPGSQPHPHRLAVEVERFSNVRLRPPAGFQRDDLVIAGMASGMKGSASLLSPGWWGGIFICLRQVRFLLSFSHQSDSQLGGGPKVEVMGRLRSRSTAMVP